MHVPLCMHSRHYQQLDVLAFVDIFSAGLSCTSFLVSFHSHSSVYNPLPHNSSIAYGPDHSLSIFPPLRARFLMFLKGRDLPAELLFVHACGHSTASV